MQDINNNLSKIVLYLFGILIILKLFTFCGRVAINYRDNNEIKERYTQLQTKADKAFAEKPPEMVMAYLDKTKNRQPYIELLKTLDNNCQENKNFLGMITISEYVQYFQDGSITMLDYLNDFSMEVGNPSEPINCFMLLD